MVYHPFPILGRNWRCTGFEYLLLVHFRFGRLRSKDEFVSIPLTIAMNLEVPVGLTTLLQDFCVAVLRERPNDLVQFAADYFKNLNENREAQGVRSSSIEQDRGSPVTFRPGQQVSSDEEEGTKFCSL